MSIYLSILKFSFLRFFAYPWEILAALISTIIEIGFFILFWSLFVKFTSQPISLISLISYFLIASGISSLVMAQYGQLESLIGKLIKTGNINNYLLKPYNNIFYFHAQALGNEGVEYLLALLTITLGLIIQPPQSLVSIYLFIIFFICAYLTSFAINILIGTIYFHTAEADGIDNCVNHIIRIFSGLLVPLYLIPHPYVEIIKLTPFPQMIFGPVNALKTNILDLSVLQDLAVAIIWVIILNIGAVLFWKYSLKKYEGIGI